MVRPPPLRTFFLKSSSRTATNIVTQYTSVLPRKQPHSTPANMSTPLPSADDSDRIYRPNTWRSFANRWTAHDHEQNSHKQCQQQQQQPSQHHETESSSSRRERRRLEWERPFDPNVSTYQYPSPGRGPWRDRRPALAPAPAPTAVYAHTQVASIPLGGAAIPLLQFPNHFSLPYQQQQQYQNQFQFHYQHHQQLCAPLQYYPHPISTILPFTPINYYSTMAAQHTSDFSNLQQQRQQPQSQLPQSNTCPRANPDSNSNPRPLPSSLRRSVTHPHAPTPTPTYLSQSSHPPKLRATAQPLLIILDLNGTLIHRVGRRPIRFKTRPGLHKFITELFAKYTVMVWTSSQPLTVREVFEKTFTKEERGKFIAVWARDTLGLTARQYSEKVQVYKRLDKVWGDERIVKTYPGRAGIAETARSVETEAEAETDIDNTSGNLAHSSGDSKTKKARTNKAKTITTTTPPSPTTWNQTNTILIDDSALKALAQPHNIIEIPEFTNSNPAAYEEKVLDTVLRQLHVLSRYEDVSCKVREWEEMRKGLQHQQQQQKKGGKGEGHGGGDGGGSMPRSHSKVDIEEFWDKQLARDEEAIGLMDGAREGRGAGAGADADADVDADVDALLANQSLSQLELQTPVQTQNGHENPVPNHIQAPQPTARLAEEDSKNMPLEGARVQRRREKKRVKKAARLAADADVAVETDAVTVVGGDDPWDSRTDWGSRDREAEGGVVLDDELRV
ncbi:hypothetical protein PAAG_03558 [Paracoccidioides lutzii Pb01]|uniref:FCP1 homology domain-containing protein n=1 Tax=Paracoccidioides lutzii (strain ATCC MYA-826 / Pb01) TaxID=502779 RepID=C1GXI4_PARBA|nr:hypothetical protein PAAG_03558 [Paracoccidioides lutzii Pb01]EEH41272.1 hypothetical protein PAAG_03558 [Paracoccidioides lutzii Pb01]